MSEGGPGRDDGSVQDLRMVVQRDEEPVAVPNHGQGKSLIYISSVQCCCVLPRHTLGGSAIFSLDKRGCSEK